MVPGGCLGGLHVHGSAISLFVGLHLPFSFVSFCHIFVELQDGHSRMTQMSGRTSPAC